MHSVQYVSLGTLAETLGFLAGHDGSARALAGGTNLVPQLRWREAKPGCKERRELRPDYLVSLRKLDELRGLSDAGDSWRVGSMTKLRELARGEVGEAVPLFRKVAGVMASPEVRNVATVGGNLCNGSPAASLLGPMFALEGRVELASSSGKRVLEMGEFYERPHQIALRPNEVMTALLLPKVACVGAWGHAEYATRPTMGMILASASVVAPRKAFGSTRQVRLALALASGRPVAVDLDLPAGLAEAGDMVVTALQPLLRRQDSKIAACHYANENPQEPAWYVERRALQACRDALASAWPGIAPGGA
jgi:CO/xanthine dehydrogenase FAD-binding subunit